MKDKWIVKYWINDSQDSGHWERTAPCSKESAINVSDHFVDYYERVEIEQIEEDVMDLIDCFINDARRDCDWSSDNFKYHSEEGDKMQRAWNAGYFEAKRDCFLILNLIKDKLEEK